jgi:hypothetical protein
MRNNISEVFFRVEQVQYGCDHANEVLKVNKLLGAQLDIAFCIPVLVDNGHIHLRAGVIKGPTSWS